MRLLVGTLECLGSLFDTRKAYIYFFTAPVFWIRVLEGLGREWPRDGLTGPVACTRAFCLIILMSDV